MNQSKDSFRKEEALEAEDFEVPLRAGGRWHDLALGCACEDWLKAPQLGGKG
jgi:hypothetical protein